MNSEKGYSVDQKIVKRHSDVDLYEYILCVDFRAFSPFQCLKMAV